MTELWLLAADIGDLIGAAVFVLFLILSMVGSLANKWRERQDEAARQARQAQRRPQPQRPLDDEIADFLRTAGERRGATGERRPPGQPPRPAQRPAQRPAERPATPRPAKLPPRPPVEQPVEAVSVEIIPERPGESLTARSLARRVGQPAAESRGPERPEDQLRQPLERGAPAAWEETASPYAAPLPPTAATGLTTLLGTGEGLRNAIILSEIFHRPEHRWE